MVLFIDNGNVMVSKNEQMMGLNDLQVLCYTYNRPRKAWLVVNPSQQRADFVNVYHTFEMPSQPFGPPSHYHSCSTPEPTNWWF